VSRTGAGTLRAADAGRRSRWPAGWRGAATTAGWRSSTCATPPASCRSWSMTRPLTGCAPSTASACTDRWRSPRGQREPGAADRRRIEVMADDVEVLSSPPRRCRSPSTTAWRQRGHPAASPVPRPAAHVASKQPADALEGQPARTRRAARARLRRDRDAHADPLHARGCPRLPGAGAAAAGPLVRAAAVAAAVQAAADGAGLERYFQIARCYRDEDFRADRQPEFTQLDIEMSFVEQEDVIDVGEAVIRALWKGILGYEIGDIPRMTYAEAMRRFGSDKPDLRFDLELTELTDYFATPRSGCSRRRTWARSSCPAGRRSRAARSTPGRSGPSSAVPGAWPT
jgi:hypothetical protein